MTTDFMGELQEGIGKGIFGWSMCSTVSVMIKMSSMHVPAVHMGFRGGNVVE